MHNHAANSNQISRLNHAAGRILKEGSTNSTPVMR